MFRISILSIGILAVVLLFGSGEAEARVISRGNPYANSNVHGINYGSMKWERERGNRRSLFQRSRRGFYRRR